MFGKIGTGELILILIIALIVVGPSKLPELGKAMGKSLGEFKRFSNDIKEDLSLDNKTNKSERTENKEVTEAEESINIENND